MMAEDWQLNKSVLQSNEHMLRNQLHCDLTFQFPESQESISAHKYVLISRSPVFCAMLTGPARDNSDVISIEDVDRDVFQLLLRFMYCEKVELTGENVMSMLYCAKKYMVSGLETLCQEFLKTQMDPSNVCTILDQVLCVDKDLVAKCLSLVDRSADHVLQSDAFADVSVDTLKKLVGRDSLEADEIDVFIGCVRWAGRECVRREMEVTGENKRRVLGEVLWMIRFPLIDSDEFLTTVASTKILDPSEIQDVLQYQKGAATSFPFVATPRHSYVTLRFPRLCLSRHTGHAFLEPSARDTEFRVTGKSKTFFLKRVFFRAPPNCEVERVWMSDDGWPEADVYESQARFDPPVRLRARVWYRLTFELSDTKSIVPRLCGTNRVSAHGVTAEIDGTTWYLLTGLHVSEA